MSRASKTPKNPTAKPRPQRKASPKRAAKPKRAQVARRRPGLLSRIRPRTAARVAVTALVLGTAVWGWRSGFVEQQGEALGSGLLRITADLGLKVRDIQVVGRERTSAEEILTALAVHRGGPMLAFDPYAARERLEALSWVQKATVERRLPDRIAITLEERQPLALWQLDGQLWVVDEQGEVIPGAKAENYGGLPLVVGLGAEQSLVEFLTLLAAEPDLQAQVVAAIRVSNRRWNIRLESGVDVKLPESGALEAWQRLARLDREQGLLSRDVVVIDLRQPDRLVVKPAPGAVVGLPIPGEDT